MSEQELCPQAARRRLYEIIRDDAPFEEKARDALELGTQYLGAQNGHLTRIDRETDSWEAMVSTDDGEGLIAPGLKLDLGVTYCRRTIESESPIALSNVPEQGWADDPEGVIEVWNEAAEDVFGFDADAVVGERIQTLGLHSDAQRSEFEKRFRHVLAGESFSDLRLQRQTADGERSYLSMSAAPLGRVRNGHGSGGGGQ